LDLENNIMAQTKRLPNNRLLNVIATTNTQLTIRWGYNPCMNGELFVRCNAKGVVNWDKTSVYKLDELLMRGNVKIIKD